MSSKQHHHDHSDQHDTQHNNHPKGKTPTVCAKKTKKKSLSAQWLAAKRQMEDGQHRMSMIKINQEESHSKSASKRKEKYNLRQRYCEYIAEHVKQNYQSDNADEQKILQAFNEAVKRYEQFLKTHKPKSDSLNEEDSLNYERDYAKEHLTLMQTLVRTAPVVGVQTFNEFKQEEKRTHETNATRPFPPTKMTDPEANQDDQPQGPSSLQRANYSLSTLRYL
jgi:hypothetical protein